MPIPQLFVAVRQTRCRLGQALSSVPHEQASRPGLTPSSVSEPTPREVVWAIECLYRIGALRCREDHCAPALAKLSRRISVVEFVSGQFSRVDQPGRLVRAGQLGKVFPLEDLDFENLDVAKLLRGLGWKV